MGFGKSPPPLPPIPQATPPPSQTPEGQAAEQAAAQEQRRRLRARSGRSSTILGGSIGGEAGTKTLLGV